MTNLYEEYALLETQEKEIKLKKEQLRPLIMEQMISNGQKKVDTGVGSFSVNKLKKWTYPERITKMEEDFKAEKAKTQSTGEATYVEEDSLRFTIVKL
jgi:hypothetical protein